MKAKALLDHTQLASASATVLEPGGVHSEQVGRAVKQVAAALSAQPPASKQVYAIVIYDKRRPEPQVNYLSAAKTFFRAYRRGMRALSSIPKRTLILPRKSPLQTLEAKNFGDVRIFVGNATPRDIREKIQSTPGIYIISSSLDPGLMQNLGLPPMPQPLRELPMVIQVKDSAVETEPHTTEVDDTIELAAAADEVDVAIQRDSLAWRQKFMSEHESLSAAQVADESTSLASNRAAIASRWVAENKIFAVEFEGQKRFPRFQFQDGRPIPAIFNVIKIFPEHATGWELAYFFVSPNSNIGGRKPVELLRQDPARLVSLAQAFVHPADVF